MSAVSDYLDSLPDEDRKVLSAVRKMIRKNIPKGYKEALYYGKYIGYVIPLSRYPNTYNKQPLGLVGVAKQKNYYSLYMLAPYGDPKELARFKEGFAKAGKKLNMGKSCVRFKKIDDLPLDVIGDSLKRYPVDEYIRRYESIKRK